MTGYLAVGHGTEPNGVFDSGAVHGQIREYDLAFTVVAQAASILSQNGILFDTETSGGPGHDPDYRGSAARINAGRYDWAVEIHFDWDKAQRGGMGLYRHDTGLAERVADAWQVAKLPFRGNVERNDLYILNTVHCPVIIWECDRVGTDITHNDLMAYGTAIAHGIMSFIGVVPTTGVEPMFQPSDKIKRLANPKGPGYWTVGADGGLFAHDGAPAQVNWSGLTNDGGIYHFPYQGAISYPGLPESARQGNRFFTDAWLD